MTEICRARGTSSRGSVHAILVQLRARGKIQWIDGRERSIVLVPDRRAGHVLHPDLQARLETFCKNHNEQSGAVLHDALTFHLDFMETELKRLGESA